MTGTTTSLHDMQTLPEKGRRSSSNHDSAPRNARGGPTYAPMATADSWSMPGSGPDNARRIGCGRVMTCE